MTDISIKSNFLKNGATNPFDGYFYSQWVVIIEERVLSLWKEELFSLLQKLPAPFLLLALPASEACKTIRCAQLCWKKMLAEGVDRKAVVLAVGGGALLDLAGFVASCYMRGIDTIYCPTTLLAMVDAAVGGKTAINFSAVKNSIGTFHLPKQVFIDPFFLSTLPHREFISGLAEIIKYAMMSGEEFLSKLELEMGEILQRREESLEKIIETCTLLKQSVIAQDEKDVTGARALLNYGHTFGHAIEALTKHRVYLHGEAVSIGMSLAAEVSFRLKLCSQEVVERQEALCRSAGLPTKLQPLSVTKLLTKMKRDKKSEGQNIYLILIEKVGKLTQARLVGPNIIREVVESKIIGRVRSFNNPQ